MPNRRHRIKQLNYHRFPVRILAVLFQEPPATIHMWRKLGVLKSYEAEDVAEFLHTYFIWRGLAADQPWHTLIAENIDPDDEGLPSPRHPGRPPRAAAGRPPAPKRRRKVRPTPTKNGPE